jgi:hypothetical protein
MLAGIDLLTGKVHAPVKDRHRSRAFIEFLKFLPPIRSGRRSSRSSTIIPHTYRKKPRLGSPPGRPDASSSPSPPTHGSRLNLIEGFFSKLTRSVLRHIRVTSKIELWQRILAGIRDVQSPSRYPHLVLQARRRRLM